MRRLSMTECTYLPTSIIPRGNFRGTAGPPRSETLAPPARSAGQFWEPERKELEAVLRSNIEQF